MTLAEESDDDRRSPVTSGHNSPGDAVLDPQMVEVDAAVWTYRHLRMSLVGLALLLLVGTVWWTWATWHLETSISAYYLGPMRDIFVGCMVGIAVLLVAYRGVPLEDFALNLAGFYALFVALVPTQLDAEGGPLAKGAAGRDAVIDQLQIAIGSILVISVVMLVVQLTTRDWSLRALRDAVRRHGLAGLFMVVSLLALVVFMGNVIYRLFESDQFDGIHLPAAILLVVSMSMVVASHGWPRAAGLERGGPEGFYQVLTGVMVLGVLVAAAMAIAGNRYWMIAVEWWEVAAFLAFWLVHTFSTWKPESARLRAAEDAAEAA
jgi:hypothetical protein